MKHYISIRVINIVLALSIVWGVVGLSSLRTDALSIDADDTVVLQGNYSDDSIIVVFTNEASLNFVEYGAHDFSDIGAKSVQNLSAPLGEKIQDSMLAITQNEGNHDYFETDKMVDSYNQIICINLEKSGKDNVISAIKQMQKRDDVEYVGPNYIYQLSSIEETIEYDNIVEQWAIDFLGLKEAWEITTGSSSVSVGVIDTGINMSHVDLINNVNSNLSRNFTSGSATLGGTTDSYGHGTKVAGIIGANGNNGIGIAGVSWSVDLISLQIDPYNETVFTSQIAAAVNYAASNNIDIVNISSNTTVYDGGLMSAIMQYDGLVVCSAGNYNIDMDTSPSYPASFNQACDNMIVVGALTPQKTKHSYSNWGNETVDLFAPGDKINTCGINYIVEQAAMTSMAAPFVTGVAALMLSINPDLTPQEIKHMIMRDVNTNVSSEVSQGCISGGALNALAAVEYARDHELICTQIDSETHSAYCLDCGFIDTRGHDFYMLSDYGDDGCIVKCSDCTYELYCPEAAEYDPHSDGHYISCPSGCFSFFEEHNKVCIEIEDNLFFHSVYCFICDYTYTDAHTWMSLAEGYMCTDCGATNAYIPGIMNIPDEELIALLESLTVEELDALLAGLDNEARNRVTAILDPSNDNLTE